MRYYNYLNENKDILNNLNNNEIYQYALSNKFLYRGADKTILNYKIFNRRKNRQPKTTDIYYHNILDNLFNKHFGWKARSEGIFATGDKQEAEGYGISYIFIPINPYSFIWSESILDLWFNIFSDEFENITDIITKDEWKHLTTSTNITTNDEIKILEKVIKTYTNKNIKKAIESKNEIMFNCNEYILFNKKYFMDYVKNEIL